MPLSPIAPIFGSSVSIFYYGIVRYLYIRSCLSNAMSQILETEQRTTLFQETIAPSYNLRLKTSAIEASCYVCGKGIQDGYSLTAKKSLGSTLLFCDKHY